MSGINTKQSSGVQLALAKMRDIYRKLKLNYRAFLFICCLAHSFASPAAILSCLATPFCSCSSSCSSSSLPPPPRGITTLSKQQHHSSVRHVYLGESFQFLIQSCTQLGQSIFRYTAQNTCSLGVRWRGQVSISVEGSSEGVWWGIRWQSGGDQARGSGDVQVSGSREGSGKGGCERGQQEGWCEGSQVRGLGEGVRRTYNLPTSYNGYNFNGYLCTTTYINKLCK